MTLYFSLCIEYIIYFYIEFGGTLEKESDFLTEKYQKNFLSKRTCGQIFKDAFSMDTHLPIGFIEYETPFHLSELQELVFYQGRGKY